MTPAGTDRSGSPSSPLSSQHASRRKLAPPSAQPCLKGQSTRYLRDFRSPGPPLCRIGQDLCLRRDLAKRGLHAPLTPAPLSALQGIPNKGRLLTQLSLFWFEKLRDVIPNHLITCNVDDMPEEVKQYREQLDGRTMLVKKATVIPLEAIVRGYITGSPSRPARHHAQL